jgi:hypothetical protein
MKVILDTKLVRIVDAGHEYQVFIALSKGGSIEHNPFPPTQEGLVAALLLAADVNAGKFYPMRVVTESKQDSKRQIAHKPTLLAQTE